MRGRLGALAGALVLLVAGPIDDVRAVVRWLDPAQRPRIVMGPTGYVKRRY